MKRVGLAAVLVAAAVATGTAASAPARDALVRPGAGIGKVRLGTTLAEVRARSVGRST